MAYPGRQNIYAAVIRKMVREALAAQEADFRQRHAADTDRQLLHYLRAQALRLGHSPQPGEITGGGYIQERFGTWRRALTLAQLPVPKTAAPSSTFARVREETDRQKALYRQRKAQKNAQAAQKRIRQSIKKKDPD